MEQLEWQWWQQTNETPIGEHLGEQPMEQLSSYDYELGVERLGVERGRQQCLDW